MSNAFYRVLALGDVVGPESVEKLGRLLPALKREEHIDLTIVNGENAAAGNGLDRKSADALFSCGVDVVTSGNHVFQKREFMTEIDTYPFLIRPANYPAGTPGREAVIFDSFGMRVLVTNVLGRVFSEPVDCPFGAIERVLAAYSGAYDLAVLDVHAEATSEKLALARYFDGRVGIVFGTHTHVQTADERILPGGTGYLTDLGMCGPVDSILGVQADCVIARMKSHLPTRFVTASGPTEITGAVFTWDKAARRCSEVSRVRRIAD